MSRQRPIDLDDRRDDVELRGQFERPCSDEVEPADFDDRRIAERFGPQPGGLFAFETYNLTDPF